MTPQRFVALRAQLGKSLDLVHSSRSGGLYDADCVDFLSTIPSDSVDMIFADPPFNLKKLYGSRVDDGRDENEYLEWSRKWLAEAVRILVPGGALFLYNLPRWNVIFGAHLLELSMQFRHWIAIDMPSRLPIPGRLHPSHYGLLYVTKGRPRVFNRVRRPIEVCRHCGEDVRDYGGYRDKINPQGINLKDIWDDIPPVRHQKYKDAERPANALSTKLVQRAIQISTKPGDLVVDPFGGSGTTFSVCGKLKRRWLGCDLTSTSFIIKRLDGNGVLDHPSNDSVELQK